MADKIATMRELEGFWRQVVFTAWFTRDKRLLRQIVKALSEIHPANMSGSFYLFHARFLDTFHKWAKDRDVWRHEKRALPYERNTKEYHNWRIECLNRDNWQCQECDKKKDLHVHHIKAYKDYKELRLDVDNGITLCKICHRRKHTR